MSKNSDVEWADHTINPWVSAANWKLPLQLNRQYEKAQSFMEGLIAQPRVFCQSVGDWLDDEVPISWLANLLRLINATPNLDWQLLTKRPENFRARLEQAYSAPGMGSDVANADWIFHWANNHGCIPANVWIGVSVENQRHADERIPQLLAIPARVRFLSCEPLLGPVEFSDATNRSDWIRQLGKKSLSGIHWVIIGGEIGPKARPCNIDWIRSIVGQCKAAGVACFVGQLGSNAVMPELCTYAGNPPPLDSLSLVSCGLRDKKGGEMYEWPSSLRVREFPYTAHPATARHR